MPAAVKRLDLFVFPPVSSGIATEIATEAVDGGVVWAACNTLRAFHLPVVVIVGTGQPPPTLATRKILA